MSDIVRPGEGSPNPGDIVSAAVVRGLPPGSAVVIDSVDGQHMDVPFTARIVTRHGQLGAPSGVTDRTVVPAHDGETYRVLWVQGQEDI